MPISAVTPDFIKINVLKGGSGRGGTPHAFLFLLKFFSQFSIIFVSALSTARAFSGTSFVIVEPAPVLALLPILTGGTRFVLQPIKQ